MSKVHHDIDAYAPAPGKGTKVNAECSCLATSTHLHLLVHGKSAPFIILCSIPSVNHGCKLCANLSACDERDKRDGLCTEGLELTSRARNLEHKRKMEELGFGSIA